MPYTPRTRDRFRLLASGLTGLTTVGVVAATGAATGLAAHQTADEAARRDVGRKDASGTMIANAPATPREVLDHSVVWKRRPHRTVVSTRVLLQAGTASFELGGATPLPGTASRGPHPGRTSPHDGPTPAASPPPTPVPSPPGPAPTSGS